MHAPAHAVVNIAGLILTLAALPHSAAAQNTIRIKVDAGEPQWIWCAGRDAGNVPVETCFFRRTFDLTDVEQAKVQVSCDDRYDLYVNGRTVGSGSDWKELKTFDI